MRKVVMKKKNVKKEGAEQNKGLSDEQQNILRDIHRLVDIIVIEATNKERAMLRLGRVLGKFLDTRPTDRKAK